MTGTTARRDDVDGLRAVAVTFVLAFHAAVPGFGGGFVGVDVFFVISGFLITALTLEPFSLADFYARRARRILPAAGTVLVATAVAAWLILPGLRLREVAADLFTSALSVANWRFVAQETDYLAAELDPSPLLHFWSLAVEEQYYLLWAPLAFLLAGRRKALAAVTVLITAGSLALCLAWDGPLAYLATPARAWQFGVGALAALAVPYVMRVPRRLAALLGTAGAVALAWSLTIAETSYPGPEALAPTLGAAVLILFRSPLSSLLAGAPMRAMGRLSFSWYLWHWPVLVLVEAAAGAQPWPAKLALAVASAAPAWLTMRLVENPVRFSAVVTELPRRGLAVGTAAMTVPVIAALVLGFVTAPGGPAEGTRTVAVAPAPAPTVDAAAARTDYPRSGGCEVAAAATTSPPCVFGTGSERVVLIGDSHAGQWFAMAQRIAQRRGWSLEVLVKPGCPLPTLTVVEPRLGREYRECDVWREHALARLEAASPPRLILFGSLSTYADARRTTTGWATTMARLERLGAPMVYLRDTPIPGFDVPECLSGRPAAACVFPRSKALPGHVPAERPGVWRLEVTDLLCPGATCPGVIDGVVLYRDDSHLTDTVVVRLAPRLEQQLENLDLIPTVL
ncbi:acyltransferase family protein [Nonomuraea sp. NPDC050663]|uniref:acyltransferase family protein n=1 Tax=Nonomuraea sp. NPDC050663 TaxID=3364370 RepID=UPI00378FCD7E